MKKMFYIGLLCMLAVSSFAQQHHPLKPISVSKQKYYEYSDFQLSGVNKPNGIFYRFRKAHPNIIADFLTSSKADIIDNYQDNWLEFYRNSNKVTLYNAKGDILWQFDLTNYIDEPNFEIQDIRLDDDILYFNSACESYSKYSNGECSALYAFDTKKEKVLWKTAYLVSNDIFILTDDLVICGYGFTAEPDYLYILNKKTGKQLSKTRLDTAHDYLELKDNVLHVITYNKYYQFNLSKYLKLSEKSK